MRVKRGVTHVARRKRLLAKTKGYRWRRKSSIRLARVASIKAGVHAYRHRKQKKRDFRALWNIRINAGARELGLTYSKLIHAMKTKNIAVNRRVLQELAAEHPETFAALVKEIQN
jgi:large subunit ribosomal protein L20